MIIVGAGGFAKEVLEELIKLKTTNEIVFYDDVSIKLPKLLYNSFKILRTSVMAEKYLKYQDNRFTLGVGNPFVRSDLASKFESLGGVLINVVSKRASVGSYGVSIGYGNNIMSNALISNNVSIGNGCIIYYNCVITHDCIIHDFVEISPNVTVLGRCEIGSFSQVGAGSTILPDTKIGKNVIIGAGSLVTKNIPDNTMVLGSPARILKQL